MTALVVTLVVGVLLVFLFGVSRELLQAQEQLEETQSKYLRSSQAVLMLMELHVPIAQMVETLVLERTDGPVLHLAWEVMERHKAACEFARGKRV